MSGSAESSQGFFSRRSFFRFSTSLAAGLGLAPLVSSAKGLSSVVTSPAEKEGEDYYAKLGVRTIINAAGTYTTLTAACMPPEVLAAVQKAALHPVRLHDLHHVATGYDTSFLGETEIAAWELGSGCAKYAGAWVMNVGAAASGILLAPRRTWRAFARGRRSTNLYQLGFDEAWLDETVEQLRRRLGLQDEEK